MVKKIKKLKGFTLIELVIVMAILVSLLTAILQLMEPVQEAYRDSTIYEQQRTVENGIISYIAENTRYAQSLSIIDQGMSVKFKDGSSYTVNSEEDAVKYFRDYNGLKDDPVTNAKIQIIRIDRSTIYKYGSTECTGRLIRRRGWNSTYSAASGTVTDNEVDTSWATKNYYMAMGSAYYGRASYDIQLPNQWIDLDGDGNKDRKNQLQMGFDIDVSPKTPQKTIDTKSSGSVTVMNYKINENVELIDYQTFSPDLDSSTGKCGPVAGTDSNENKDTYIVFIRPNTV